MATGPKAAGHKVARDSMANFHIRDGDLMTHMKRQPVMTIFSNIQVGDFVTVL